MKKITPTNNGFELGHSRMHEILSKRGEVNLAGWFIVGILVCAIIGIVLGVAVSL